MKIEEDAILGEFFDTPEKKARWMKRIVYLYLVWIFFIIGGLVVAILVYLLK